MCYFPPYANRYYHHFRDSQILPEELANQEAQIRREREKVCLHSVMGCIDAYGCCS